MEQKGEEMNASCESIVCRTFCLTKENCLGNSWVWYTDSISFKYRQGRLTIHVYDLKTRKISITKKVTFSQSRF